MKKAGRSAAYIFGLWSGIAVISGIAALLGYVIVGGMGDEVVAATDGVAAGAILSMIADTMIPEAFEIAHDYAGLTTRAFSRRSRYPSWAADVTAAGLTPSNRLFCGWNLNPC
jgi:zinc transporter ZupT